MKAQDTVMTPEQRYKIWDEHDSYDISQLMRIAQEAQAEISFKAGVGDVVREIIEDICKEGERKKGMREVVEWLDDNPVFIQNKGLGIKVPIAMSPDWETKLKEWGI